jgi:hypothetical protein
VHSRKFVRVSSSCDHSSQIKCQRHTGGNWFRPITPTIKQEREGTPSRQLNYVFGWTGRYLLTSHRGWVAGNMETSRRRRLLHLATTKRKWRQNLSSWKTAFTTERVNCALDTPQEVSPFNTFIFLRYMSCYLHRLQCKCSWHLFPPAPDAILSSVVKLNNLVKLNLFRGTIWNLKWRL